jgi:aminobenzoyl-glutamate transport protein
MGRNPDEELKAELAKSALTPEERRGLRYAGVVALLIVALFTALSTWPGYTPLIDETKTGTAQLQPFYGALVAGFFSSSC